MHGIEVLTFPNPVLALDRLAALPAPPDLLLVDLHLPLMDGATFVRNYHAAPGAAHPPAPVVVMSADSDAAFAASEREALGIVGWLPKPFDLEELVALVLRTHAQGAGEPAA